MSLSFLSCYQSAPGKKSFVAPVTFNSAGFGGANPIASASVSSFTSPPVGAITQCPDGNNGISTSDSGFSINGAGYAVTGADYLAPANQSPGFPGYWSTAFNLYIPLNLPPPPPGLNLVAILLKISGNYQGEGDGVISFNDSTANFPWPFPEVMDASTYFGVKFVDQFGQPYKAFDLNDGNLRGRDFGSISYTNVGQYAPQYGSVGVTGRQIVVDGKFVNQTVIKLTMSFAHLYTFAFGVYHNELYIGDFSSKPGDRRLCYPRFTWDSTRMAAIAAWFSQWPCKLVYYLYPNQQIVDASLGIDYTKIGYGPVNFTLSRPICKPFGILNPCSS